jgi:AAA+ superfamily predicted ATPase
LIVVAMTSDNDSEYDDSEVEQTSLENPMTVIPLSLPLNSCVLMNRHSIQAIGLSGANHALARSRRGIALAVKVIQSAACPAGSVQVPRLVLVALETSARDQIGIVPFEVKTETDRVQVAAISEMTDFDEESQVTSYFQSSPHLISRGSIFSLFVDNCIHEFRVTNILPSSPAVTCRKTRVFCTDPARRSTSIATHFSDLAIQAEVLQNVQRYIQTPVQQPAMLAALGVPASGGVIIHGQQGTGRTTLLTAIGRETGVHHQLCNCADILNGQAIQRLTAVFAEAHRRAPSLLLLDDADDLLRDFSSRRLASDRRLTAVLLYLLDRTFAQPGVVVVATVASMSNVDPILLRSGRFVVAFGLQEPGPTERGAAISLNTRGIPLDESVIYRLSVATNGMLFGEIEKIVGIAVNRMLKRVCPSGVAEWQALEVMKLDISDFPIDLSDGQPESTEATPGGIQPNSLAGFVSFQQPGRIGENSLTDSAMDQFRVAQPPPEGSALGDGRADFDPLTATTPAAQQQSAPLSSGHDLSLFGSVAQNPLPTTSAGSGPAFNIFTVGPPKPPPPTSAGSGPAFNIFTAGPPKPPPPTSAGSGPAFDIFTAGPQNPLPTTSAGSGPAFDIFSAGLPKSSPPTSPGLRGDLDLFGGGQQSPLRPASSGLGADFIFAGGQPPKPAPTAGANFDVFLAGQQQQPPSPSRANFDQFPDGQQQPPPPAPSFDIFRSDQAPLPGGQQQRSAPASYGPGPDFASLAATQQQLPPQSATPKPAAAPEFDLSRTGPVPAPQRRAAPGAVNSSQSTDQQFAMFDTGDEGAHRSGQKSAASPAPHVNTAVSVVPPGMPPQGTGSRAVKKTKPLGPLQPQPKRK